MSPLFDTVARPRLKAVFEYFRNTRTTILYFSNRPEDLVLDGYLWLGLDRQLITENRDVFDDLRAAAGRETIDGD